MKRCRRHLCRSGKGVLGRYRFIGLAAILLLHCCNVTAQGSSSSNSRPPADEADLRYWLENMSVYHRFSVDEMAVATGLSTQQVASALGRFGLDKAQAFRPGPDAAVLVLPYPGGRHPRIGFLEGAVDPQRETKVSVFTPWDPASYVVVDVPEAIWSNLGLTYLAHTHLDTIWSRTNLSLPKLEWKRLRHSVLEMQRTLPNNITFGTTVTPERNRVRFDLWFRNGTAETLRELRVQNCVMLKQAAGFADQTNTNKIFESPFAAVRSAEGGRWIICAFEPCDRTWGNEKVPCLHSDPKFPDCAPGETQKIRGWLSFYEGEDIQKELERLRHSQAKQRNGSD